MTAPADAYAVSLDGTQFWGLDDYGAEYWVQAVDGWDGADVRQTVTPQPNSHGAFDPVTWYDARKLTLSGTIIAPSAQDRRNAEDRLRRACGLGRIDPVTLRVDEAPFARQATVWLAGKPTFAAAGQTLSTFSVPFIATDPFRYDVNGQGVFLGLPLPSTGFTFPATFNLVFGVGALGDMTVTNAGDADSWPTLHIQGPATNPTVRNNTTGDQLTLSITLAATDYLDIDCRPSARTVVLNGSASRRSSVQAGSRFPSVSPGDSVWQFRASAYQSAAQLTVSFSSAWA